MTEINPFLSVLTFSVSGLNSPKTESGKMDKKAKRNKNRIQPNVCKGLTLDVRTKRS